jgi:hypothetical protein
MYRYSSVVCYKLLNEKVDVDDKEFHYGWTALMFAAYQVGAHW